MKKYRDCGVICLLLPPFLLGLIDLSFSIIAKYKNVVSRVQKKKSGKERAEKDKV